MNVLVSAYACRPNAGSEPGTGWNWAVHLAEAGCEVYLFTADRNREEIEAYLGKHRCPQLHPNFVSVPWMDPIASGARHYLLWQWLMLRRARALAQAISFDIVHHVSYGSVHIPTPLWRLGIPTVFGPVGGGQTAPANLLSYFGARERSERQRTWLTNLLPRLGLYRSRMKQMRLVLAANTETMELVQRAGCGNVKLMCDTGSRLDFCSDAPRVFSGTTPIRFLWVGRFLPRKGLALALDALAETREKIHLTLVGDGMSKEAIQRMIDDRGLCGRVHWEGVRLPWVKVREAYVTHDGLLFTSLRDSFGSQNLEAMCVGLPIVGLNLGGGRDFIPRDAALKVDVGDSAASTVRDLAAALDRFADLSLASRNQMSEAAWRSGQAFSWPARIAYAISLYKELLG
jgi:glycosyltransferase involved in cell wall biosynthesis